MSTHCNAKVTKIRADEMHLLGNSDSDVVMFVWSTQVKEKVELSI